MLRRALRMIHGLRWHSVVAVGMLVVMTAGGLGIPVIPVVQKDRTQPFPCRDRACACRDAEACWQSCCCLSDSEKLDWAHDHGVRPPLYLVERVQASNNSRGSQGEACGTCCKKDSSDEGQTIASEEAEHGPALVMLRAQNRCQAHPSWLALLSSALVEPIRSPWSPDFSWSHPIDVQDCTSPLFVQQPAIPPPRLA